MKKLIVKCMAFLLIVGGLTASFLFSKPKNDVKADTPSLYYFDFDTSYQNYLQIIFYMKDLDLLIDDTCLCGVFGYNQGTYVREQSYLNIQFLRYSVLDHDDWDAYVYNLNYINNANITYFSIYIYASGSNGNGLEGESTRVNQDYCFVYYPTFSVYYDEGNAAGYQDGVNDRNAYWDEYIEETYESTTGSGYQRIFEYGRQAGFTQGQDSLNTMEWFETTASGVSSILQLKLLPSITIGALIFIPLMFLILKGVLWIWRRN